MKKNPTEKTEQTEQVNSNEQKISELTADLQRLRADFENYRKQTEIQKSQAMNITKLTTVSRILPLIDDVDRAISSYPEQLAPLKKTIEKTLNELRLRKINSEAGVEFDPNLHEAVMFEEGDGEKEVIVETLRPGYFYGEEIVRTAMVKVGKN